MAILILMGLILIINIITVCWLLKGGCNFSGSIVAVCVINFVSLIFAFLFKIFLFS